MREQVQPRLHLALVPNPNTGMFILQGSAQLAGKKATANIIDNTGRLVKQQQGNFNTDGSFPVSAPGLPHGIYTVQLLIGQALVANEKMVVE